MVSFDDCQGNPGALSFMVQAYSNDPFYAESCFDRVITGAGIRGSELYILWNDCCGRDTDFALKVMKEYDIEEIKRCVRGQEGRGIPFKRD